MLSFFLFFGSLYAKFLIILKGNLGKGIKNKNNKSQNEYKEEYPDKKN